MNSSFSNKIKSVFNNEYSSMFRHIRNYFASSVFTKFMAFISIPIFTRLLGPEGYGVTGLFISITSVIAIISALGIDSSVKRYYFEENSNQSEFISTNLILATFFNLLLILSLFQFGGSISKLSGIPKSILFYGLIVGILFAYKSIVFGIWQSRKQSGLIGKTSVLNGIITISISVLLVIILDSYLGQIYGYLIGAIIVAVAVLIKIKEELTFTFKYKHVIYSLFLGLPLVINQLAGYILSFFDRIIINKYFGLVDVGIYSFAYNVAMIMEMVIYSINSAWIPIMFEKMRENAGTKLQAYFELLTKIVLLSATVLIIFSSEIAMILADERYIKALPIIPVVIFGYLFKYLYTFYSNVEYYYKKTKALAFFSIIAGVINILLNIIFVSNYGAIAAAYTTLVSYMLLFIFHFFYVFKIIKYQVFDFKKIVLPVFMMFIILIGNWTLHIYHENIKLIITIKSVLIAALLLLYFKDTIRRGIG